MVISPRALPLDFESLKFKVRTQGVSVELSTFNLALMRLRVGGKLFANKRGEMFVFRDWGLKAVCRIEVEGLI